MSVTSNFSSGELRKIERNDGELLRVKTLLVDWRSENSESVKQYSRIVWASRFSPLEVARYDCLPHHFSAYDVGVLKKTSDST